MNIQVVDAEILEQIAAEIGTEIMPNNKNYCNRFTVNSTSSSKVYVVSQRVSDGVWCCGCVGWTHHRKCKHLTDVLQRLAKVEAKLDEQAARMLASARQAYLYLDDAVVTTSSAASIPLIDLR